MLWHEIEEQNPEKLHSVFDSSSADLAYPSIDQLKVDLKKLKIFFTEADSSRRFAQHARSRQCFEAAVPGARDAERREAKAAVRALKQQVLAEEECQRVVMQEVKDARNRARVLYRKCIEALTALTNDNGDVDMDLGLAESLWQSGQQAKGGIEQVTHFWKTVEGQMMQRKDLEKSLATLEELRRDKQAVKQQLIELQDKLLHELKIKEATLPLEATLGLPQVEFDDDRHVATFGRAKRLPPGAEEARRKDEELRSVEVSFDNLGRLVRARPNPLLGLDQAAEQAAVQDDLARLLTKAWNRLLETSDDGVAPAPPSEAMQLGGA